MFFFFKWVRISPEIDWYHHQCCFPDKMSYDPTFLVKNDILTDSTFCSPTVHCAAVRGHQERLPGHQDDGVGVGPVMGGFYK